MKILVFSSMLVLFGCAQMFPAGKSPTVVDRTYSCMLELIGKLGVEPKKAQRICDRTFRSR